MENICSVGELIEDSDACHKTVHCRTTGLTLVGDLPKESFELLQLRTESSLLEGSSTICCHHEAVLITHYEVLQIYCCDTFNTHAKRVTKWLRTLDVQTAKQLNLKPGQKLCKNCYCNAVNESKNLINLQMKILSPRVS